MSDLVIRGARVADGTGSPWFRADVAIAGDRIEAIGAGLAARRIVDADDRVLAPGFIDMHSHDDAELLDRPDAVAKVAQGVTTQLLGQDGISIAPALRGSEELVERIAGELDGVPAEGCRWPSVDAYLRRLDETTAVNVAHLAPHGTLRAQVLAGEERPAAPRELERLGALVADALADGAFGLSTGLEYVPSRATETSELAALLEPVAAVGGIHVSHIRDYDRGLDAAIAELLDLSRATGVPAHFSHFVAWGRRNHGRMPELLAGLDAARAAGVDATLDVYPYTAGSTVASYFLPAALRSLAPDELVARTRTAGERERLAEAIDRGPAGVDAGWDAFEIASGADAVGVAADGARLPTIAEGRGQRVGELICDLLSATDGRAVLIVHACREDDVRAALAHPVTSIGSDGVPIGELPHPRGWGSFARVLESYVREDGVLGLEQAVAAMTGRPAARLGIGDRGLIRPGMAADLVLFDAASVRARATFREPRSAAAGFDLVLVNGRVVWTDGRATGDLPGRALRRGRPQEGTAGSGR